MAVRLIQLNRHPSTSTTTTSTTTKAITPIIPIILLTMDAELLRKFTNMVNDCYRYTDVTHSRLVPGQVYDENGTWCPRIFDGFACWDGAPPGTIVTQNCPAIVIGFNPQLPVYKACTKNGSWLVQIGSNRSWTDYTSCIDVADLKFRTNVNLIYVIGYWVSVAALLISLAIFLFFRSLRCTRIRIHMHLFLSVALNNILWIIWYKIVVDDVDVVKNNKTWCQILHVFVNYFMVTTYLWMFCEALHLHISLVVVFVKDNVALQWFKAVGWGVSLIVVMAYAIVRYIYGNIERCWMDTSDTFWIITAPVMISLLTSFVFLVNVVRVLITKLQPGPVPNYIVAAKKAARAALLLIPLFGLHFLLIPLRPSPGSSFERVYEILSAIIISLQGLCVSILFCFTNHEVTTAARTHWARICNRNRRADDLPMTGVTAGESINTRENVV